MIEIVFNRYLLPSSVNRQTFVLHDTSPTGPAAAPPTIAYDPVARIVTITPAPSSLMADRDEVLVIDSNALQAIDGAGLGKGETTVFNFTVVAGDGGTPPPPVVDFCRDIQPIFAAGCSGFCHTQTGTYAALDLSSPAGVLATAVGRTAHGANTGPRSTPEPPGPIFGVDMPIIDPGDNPAGGGDPAHSWLMYKVLMAQPPTTSGYTYMGCNGSYAPTDVTHLHAATQPAFADEANDPERANLANMISGREMPFPFNPGAAPPNAFSLTVDELERVNLWIAAGPNGADGGADAATYLPSGACGCIQ